MKRYGLMVVCALLTTGMLGILVYAGGAMEDACFRSSDGGAGSDGGSDGGGPVGCQSDQDCGPGLVCHNGQCVSMPDAGGGIDAGPPED